MSFVHFSARCSCGKPRNSGPLPNPAFTLEFQDRMKLQQVKLLVEVFTCDDEDASNGGYDPDPAADRRSFSFRTSALSEVITNSKSKECGPLQLHDVNPNISCCESESKIFVLSFFKVRWSAPNDDHAHSHLLFFSPVAGAGRQGQFHPVRSPREEHRVQQAPQNHEEDQPAQGVRRV